MTTMVTTATQRVLMEQHASVRAAGKILWADYYGVPRDIVRAHAVRLLLHSCIKQERWSRGQDDPHV